MRKITGSLSEARNEVERLFGKPVRIRYNKGRNKIAYYDGEVSEIYNSVFVIKIENECFSRLSCSYKDVLCGDVKFRLKS